MFFSMLLIAQLAILYIMESRLIGLKLFGFVGSSFPFCSNSIMAVLRVMDSIPFTFISLTDLVIRGAKDGQKVLRKLIVKPSIPGAEFGFIFLIEIPQV